MAALPPPSEATKATVPALPPSLALAFELGFDTTKITVGAAPPEPLCDRHDGSGHDHDSGGPGMPHGTQDLVSVARAIADRPEATASAPLAIQGVLFY